MTNSQKPLHKALWLIASIVPYAVVSVAWHVQVGLTFIYSVGLLSDELLLSLFICLFLFILIFSVSYIFLFKTNLFSAKMILLFNFFCHLLVSCFMWLLIESRLDKYLI